MGRCCTTSLGRQTCEEHPRLSSSGFERISVKQDRTKHPDTSDVEGTVSRSHITNAYQKDIDQSPDAQASKAEQLAQTFSPLAQIKPISSKTSKCDAAQRAETQAETLPEHQQLLPCQWGLT